MGALQELKEHSGLLLIVALLVLAKFVVMPILEYQENLVFENVQLAKKINKAERAISNKSVNSRKLEQYKKQLNDAERIYFKEMDESSFKLVAQQSIEKLFLDGNVKLKNTNWTSITPINGIEATEYKIELQFDGALISVINLMMELEQQSPLIDVVDFNVRTRGTNVEELGMVKGGRFGVLLYLKHSEQG